MWSDHSDQSLQVSNFRRKPLGQSLSLCHSAPDVFACWSTSLPTHFRSMYLFALHVLNFFLVTQRCCKPSSYISLAHFHTRLPDFRSGTFCCITTTLGPWIFRAQLSQYCQHASTSLARNDIDDNEEDPRHRPGPFRLLSDYVRYCTYIYNAINTIAGLDLVLRASGFWGKILLAMDLFVESHLVVLANFILFFSVGIFVGTALEGLPLLMDLILNLWILVEYIIHPPQEPLEADFEENEAPADDPFHEEWVLEEDEVL